MYKNYLIFAVGPIIAVLLACGLSESETPRSQNSAQTEKRSTQQPERQTRTIQAGDVTRVNAEPYRWNTGPRWDFRWIFDDYDRMERCVKHTDYLKAEEDGIAHRLSFGTKIKVVTVKPGFKYWATDFEIEVLNGELSGKTGWTDFKTIKDYYITE